MKFALKNCTIGVGALLVGLQAVPYWRDRANPQ